MTRNTRAKQLLSVIDHFRVAADAIRYLSGYLVLAYAKDHTFTKIPATVEPGSIHIIHSELGKYHTESTDIGYPVNVM